MEEKRILFTRLPKVDQILNDTEIQCLLEKCPRDIVVNSIREVLESLRRNISKGSLTVELLDEKINQIPNLVNTKVYNKLSMKFKKVINGTGVIIHTNLGRSLVGQEVMQAVTEVATNYSNLEYDLENGTRGSRYSHVEEILTMITGAESALVVNNNAAAVMLALSSIAKNREVIVSRGELVEIGGSFRVPDVMEQSGAKLVDVGTTNKTHLWDYEKAIGEDTTALMKVHTSNYRILGFTASVDLKDLVELGRKNGIPVIEDLGSGVLIDLTKYGLDYEPTVQDSIRAGVDIVTFSGDKLLGGPQAGILVGRKEYIDIMKKNPLTRALRVDKFTLSALEATLRLYLDEKQAVEKIPTLRMLTASLDKLQEKAIKLRDLIRDKTDNKLNVEIVNDFSQVGGGSLPLEEIPTKAVVLCSDDFHISALEKRLRRLENPIITRVYKEKMYIDLRTVVEEDFELIGNGIRVAIENI